MSIQFKRICSLVLALVMVCGLIYVGPIEASAKTTTCPIHGKDCTAEWITWDLEAGARIAEDGHYRLAADVEGLNSQYRIGTADDAKTTDVDERKPVNVVIDLAGHDISGSSRIFYVNPGSTLTIIDSTDKPGTLTSNYAGIGGVLYVDSGKENEYKTTLNLYDVTVDSTREAPVVAEGEEAPTINNAGALYVGNYSDVVIKNATIDGGYSNQGGSIWVRTGSTVTIKSGLITGGTADQGGNIYLGGSTLNIEGGVIENGVSYKASKDNYGGGNIMMSSSNSVLNISGGVITGGKDTNSSKDSHRGGGNIYLQGTMNMTGGTISYGSTNASGGNILVRGTLNMSGGSIIGGVAMADGGNNLGVRNKEGIVNISGGSIIGGEVSIIRNDTTNGTFTLSGAPVIDNIVIANNTSGYTLTDGGLSKNAKIGVTAAEGQQIFTDPATTYVPVNRAAYTNTICPVCQKEATWTEWTGAITEAGHYYLGADVTSGGQLKIMENVDPATVCIDLNGHSFLKQDTALRAFNVYGGSTLNLFNTSDFESFVIGSYAKDDAGVINLDVASNLNLYEGITIVGAAANDGMAKHSAGAVQIGTGILNIYGGTIVGQTVKNGGAILVNAGGTLNLYGGTIVGAKATSGGAIAVLEGGTFNMAGGVVDGGTANNGGAVYVANGTFNMTAGTIKNGKTNTGAKNYYGGNLYISGKTAVANISGGTVEYGWSCSNGGNIYLGSSANLTISGNALIQNGEAVYTLEKSLNNNYGGGNIYVHTSTLNVKGGTIQGGVSNHAGGNIYARGTVNISGGEILGGTARSNTGSSIAIRNEATATISGGTINGGIAAIRGGMNLTLSGAPTIADINLVDYVNDGVVVALNLGEGGVTGGSIGITGAEGAISAASSYASASSKYFTSNDSAYEISVNANQICLSSANIPTQPSVISKACPHCGKVVEWNAWAGGMLNKEEHNNGHYFLTENITSGGQIYIGASDGSVVNTVCVDLNGYNISKPAATKADGTQSTYRAFAVYGGSTLNLMNTAATESVVTGSYTADMGGVINLSGTSTLNLYDGVVLQSSATDYAEDGGIICVGAGTLNMYGGTINGQSAARGGAIFVNKGTFNMKGGLISGGSVATGEKITAANGGNVCIVNGNFSMTGGTISGGEVIAAEGAKASAGGNIFIENNSSYSASITGGTIENGKATNGNGGNIYVNTGTLNIGGTALITNGNATRAISRTNGGGNIYAQASAILNITGGTISNGTSESYGGNIAARKELNISGGVITNGTAPNGGNIFVNGYDRVATLNITGGTISNGTATTGKIDKAEMVKEAYDGDNIYVNSAVANISGGSISDNDGGNAVLAYTHPNSIAEGKEFYAIVNLSVANNSVLANALNGLVYMVEGAKWTSDLGGVFIDEDGDRIWAINGEPEPEPEPEGVPGDMNGDGEATNDDVVALLWHCLFPDQYPLEVNGDLNGDGEKTNDDVVKLLWFCLFPEQYPL